MLYNPALLLEVNFQEVAARLLRKSARVQPRERVTILGRADSLDFCEALELECRRLRAFPFVVVGSDAALVAALLDPSISIETLSQPSPQLLAALSASDLVITTFFNRADPACFNGVSPERLQALRRSEEKPGDIIFDGQRRWLGTEVPTPQQANALSINWPVLHNLYWKAMLADYEPIQQQAARLAALYEKAAEVHLTGSAGKTDLKFLIGGRPIEKDDGIIDEADRAAGQLYLNMPSGEICFAPLEASARGRAFVELAFWEGRAIRGLELEFKAGEVQAIRAEEGLEIFRLAVLSGGEDGGRLGEFGLGLNPAVKQVTGFLLLDEKMLGTVHLALGENRPLGGVNNSALHWDLVIQQPSVALDGKLIMEKGELLV